MSSLPHTTKLFLTDEEAIRLLDLVSTSGPDYATIAKRLQLWKKRYDRDVKEQAQFPPPFVKGERVLVLDPNFTNLYNKIGRITSVWFSGPRRGKPAYWGYMVNGSGSVNPKLMQKVP